MDNKLIRGCLGLFRARSDLSVASMEQGLLSKSKMLELVFFGGC